MDDDFDDRDGAPEVEKRPTEGVRIFGATEASDLVGPRGAEDAPPASEAPPSEFEMPHWTEPATGEVPSVLARDEGAAGEAGASMSGPIWSDDKTGWQQDDFDHSMLAVDAGEGALDDSAERPAELFSFDDLDEASGPILRSGTFGEAPDYGRTGSGPFGTLESFGDVSAGPSAGAPGEDLPEVDQDPYPGGDPETGAVPVAEAGFPGVGSVVGERRTVRIGSSGRPDAAPTGGPGRPGSDTVPRPGRPADRNVAVAVTVGLGIGAVIVVLFLFGPATALLVSTVAVTLAVAEYFAVMRRAGYQPASLLGLIATVCLLVAAYVKGEPAVSVVVAITVVLTLLWYLWGVSGDRAVAGVAVTILGFLWVSFLGSFAALLLNPDIHPQRHGVALLFGAIVATVAYDVAAYVAGSRFGKHPLAPRISPKKTWEGLAGGMVTAIVVAVVFVSHLHPWSVKRALLLGVVVAVVAPLGDLCQSMIKRDAGVKDMSAALPGHGGVLDRIDAMLFVMPAVYFLARVLNIS